MAIQTAVVASENPQILEMVDIAFRALAIYLKSTPCKTTPIVGILEGLPRIEHGSRVQAEAAKRFKPDADFHIAVTNGLFCQDGKWSEVSCAHICFEEKSSRAFGTHCPIPRKMAEEALNTGKRLEYIISRISGGTTNDPHQWFSKGAVSRPIAINLAIRYALLPLLYQDRFQE